MAKVELRSAFRLPIVKASGLRWLSLMLLASVELRSAFRLPIVKASGLRWLSLMLLASIPWAGRIWALPFLTALAPSERCCQSRGRQHKMLTDWGRQESIQNRGVITL